jgi:serine O-acetyltransferase
MNQPVNENLSRLAEALIESYNAQPQMQRVGHAFLPSRGAIVEMVEDIRSLLFPGYFGSRDLTGTNVRFHVGNMLSRLGEQLAEQVYHCMSVSVASHCSEDCDPSQAQRPCPKQAAQAACDFLGHLPAIREALALDAQAAYDGDPAAKSIDEVIYSYPGYYAVTVYRIAHDLLELGVPLMPRIMSEHAHSITGCDIHPGARIGRSFFIDHATGVVIGETTRIGDSVKIYQGVTLGALSFPKDERGRVIKGLQRHPTIEDNVTIYANATILGGETVIGRGVTVGGNTFVSASIPPESTVMQSNGELQVKPKKRK